MKLNIIVLLLSLSMFSIGWLWKENPKIDEYLQKGFAAYKEGNLAEALTYYEQVLVIRPNYVEAVNFSGVIYEELGEAKKAEERYLTALRINKDYMPAYYNLGMFYWNQGQIDMAVYYLQQRVKKGNPKDYWTIKTKNALKNIEISQTFSRQSKRDNSSLSDDRYRRGVIYRDLDTIEYNKHK